METLDVLRVKSERFFPVAILKEGTSAVLLVKEPDGLPRGIPFRVISTNVTVDQFMLLEHFAKQVADKLVAK